MTLKKIYEFLGLF